MVVVLLILVMGAGASGPGMVRSVRAADAVSETGITLGFDCQVDPSPLPRATALMQGTLVLDPHPAMRLPANPTWAENPFKDRNWDYQYHTLRFLWDLFGGWRDSGDQAMLDRAMWLISDWVRDNPRSDPPSVMSWNDHSTAWRAMVLACAYEVQPSTWLRTAMTQHATILADPTFYRGHGNHALNQARGLLRIGCALQRADWMNLATSRLGALVAESIDGQGVTNEQAVGYQGYNYTMYKRAQAELEECGRAVPAAFASVDRMPGFIAHASVPDRKWAMIGDTSLSPSLRVPGTVAEYAATGGLFGPMPSATFVVYKAGFAFGRTGWGTTRAYTDEVVWSARFGPGRIWHGHHDHTSITLYGWGQRLIDDAGIFTANSGAWRTFAIGRTAHNVVTVDGLKYDPSRTSPLLRWTRGTRYQEVLMRDRGYPGVTIDRRVVFSSGLGWMYVEDRITATRSRTFRQLWHLWPGANPTLASRTVKTAYPTGNVSIVQLADADRIRFVKGRTDPIQGWMSRTLNDRTAAVTVETVSSGTTARYVTLLIPKPSVGTSVRVTDRTVTSTGAKFTVWVGTARERVSISATGISVVTVP